MPNDWGASDHQLRWKGKRTGGLPLKRAALRKRGSLRSSGNDQNARLLSCRTSRRIPHPPEPAFRCEKSRRQVAALFSFGSPHSPRLQIRLLRWVERTEPVEIPLRKRKARARMISSHRACWLPRAFLIALSFPSGARRNQRTCECNSQQAGWFSVLAVS